jgi:hypothetical protein
MRNKTKNKIFKFIEMKNSSKSRAAAARTLHKNVSLFCLRFLPIARLLATKIPEEKN